MHPRRFGSAKRFEVRQQEELSNAPRPSRLPFCHPTTFSWGNKMILHIDSNQQFSTLGTLRLLGNPFHVSMVSQLLNEFRPSPELEAQLSGYYHIGGQIVPTHMRAWLHA